MEECTEVLRMELWEDLRNTATSMNSAWGVVDDFNTITNCEEKKGGRNHRMEESLDFLTCLHDCGLLDAGYSGSTFTWCDNRDPPTMIWKRLDRIIYNSRWFDCLNATSVTYLSRSCSDHAPLLIKIDNEITSSIQYFRFLNFWAKHLNFLKSIKDIWDHKVYGNPLYVLHQKLKNTSKHLNIW